MKGSFPWRDSSSPRIGFSRGPGDGPLVGGEGGVGGRGGDGPRGGGGDGDCFDGFHTGDSLAIGGGAASVGCGIMYDFGLGVIAEDNARSSLTGVGGRVFTNFCSYDDLISLGLVGSGFGSARNIRLRRSSVQYRSSGVDHRGSSPLLVRTAGSTRTACQLGGVEDRGVEVGGDSVLMIGSGFSSTSFRSLELSLLVAHRNGTFEVMAKSLAMFGDIGDGVESPGHITAVGGEEVYRGRCMGESRGLFSWL